MTRFVDRRHAAHRVTKVATAMPPARSTRLPRPSAVTLLLAACLAGPVTALESDREQPIYLEADSVEIDERRGISVYRGHVKVTQGSSELTADEVTVNQTKEGDRVVATGSPATFSQQRDNRPEPVRGSARRIEHRSAENLLILTGAAEFSQGGDRFSSERIEYDTRSDLVRAGQAAGAAKPGERVRIVIQPRPSRDRGDGAKPVQSPGKP